MNRIVRSGLRGIALALGCVGAARGDVKLPAIFGDHMVLQQESKLPVWGTADPGEKVTVTACGESGSTTAGGDGTWRVDLPALPAAPHAITLTVSGKNTLSFQDVLVGDVWICSGQSNMEFSLAGAHNGKEAVAAATDPQLRLFVVAHNAKLDPQTDVSGTWQVCAPQTVPKFSAVGYFFGRELRKTLQRPVGLIETSVGGTPAQAWTSFSGLQKDPELKAYVDLYKNLLGVRAKNGADYPAKMAEYQANLAKWNKEVAPTFNPILGAWRKAAQAAQIANQPAPPAPVPPWPQPRAPLDPNGEAHQPACLYNGMIAPLIPYAIKGAIWYQGESNASRAAEYKVLFARMITDWREKWGQGNFPFLFVQLAGFDRNGTNDTWPFLRESQADALTLPATGMATAYDIGDPLNIHPQDKLDVGLRLSLVARDLVYGQKLVDSGPVYDTMKVEGDKVRVSFKELGGGLVIGSAPWHPQDVLPIPTDKLVGFALAGGDKVFYEADAAIDGDTVVVSSAQVPQPVAVRYAWRNTPVANLYNKANLPALPFRSDDFPPPTVWGAGSIGAVPLVSLPPAPTAPSAPPTPPAAK